MQLHDLKEDFENDFFFDWVCGYWMDRVLETKQVEAPEVYRDIDGRLDMDERDRQSQAFLPAYRGITSTSNNNSNSNSNSRSSNRGSRGSNVTRARQTHAHARMLSSTQASRRASIDTSRALLAERAFILTEINNHIEGAIPEVDLPEDTDYDLLEQQIINEQRSHSRTMDYSPLEEIDPTTNANMLNVDDIENSIESIDSSTVCQTISCCVCQSRHPPQIALDTTTNEPTLHCTSCGLTIRAGHLLAAVSQLRNLNLYHDTQGASFQDPLQKQLPTAITSPETFATLYIELVHHICTQHSAYNAGCAGENPLLDFSYENDSHKVTAECFTCGFTAAVQV